MNPRNSVLLRLGISLCALSGGAYYALVGSEERAAARKMEHLARQVVMSTRDNTPLHERALSSTNRLSIEPLRESLVGSFELSSQVEKEDAWEFGYCFRSGSYVVLSMPMNRSQPTLQISKSPKCLVNDQ